MMLTAALAADAGSEAFAKKAAEGSKMEVRLSELAVQKAADPDVKAFAKTIANDHKQANKDLKAAASKENIQLPDEMSAKGKSTYEHLEGLSGEAFDRAYIQHMIEDHKADIALYEKRAKGDDALATFASNTLPTLREHLKKAQDLQSEVGLASRSDVSTMERREARTGTDEKPAMGSGASEETRKEAGTKVKNQQQSPPGPVTEGEAPDQSTKPHSPKDLD